MSKLTHLDQFDRPSMVDVGNKPHQKRIAVASGKIFLHPNTISLITENKIKKGNVLTTCELAGIIAGKKTSELIPLCHQLNLTKLDVLCIVESDGIKVESTAICIGQTGVEMEALCSVSIGLLTIYDMCKAVDKNMLIGEIKLNEKRKESI